MAYLNGNSLFIEMGSKEIFSMYFIGANDFGVQSIQNSSVKFTVSQAERYEVLNYTTFCTVDKKDNKIFLGYRGFYRAYAAEYLYRLAQSQDYSSKSGKYTSFMATQGKFLGYQVLYDLDGLKQGMDSPNNFQNIPDFPWYHKGERSVNQFYNNIPAPN
jgi:hypothetical protein